MKELRMIPATHRFLNHPVIQKWMVEHKGSKQMVMGTVRLYLQEVRERLKSGEDFQPSIEPMVEEIMDRLSRQQKKQLVPVINATGIILHTNLGRAVLPKSAVQHMVLTATRYSNLEYSIEQGTRGSRHYHVERLIQELTGAEAAMVVNNNAAAVFLVLRELAAGKEVVVSRGQLVEIGGSFRISEIMKESGALLREVGTTNKTRISDYEQAINGQTALLLNVHTSNFRTIGFTESVTLDELAYIGKIHRIPVYGDLGSGALYDLRKHGIGDEPLVPEAIRQGADLVSFSGDKLLGGPQAGIIVGRKALIERLKKNQLARILRVDKMTLAALESTLRLYGNEQRLLEELPTLRDICMPLSRVKEKAIRLRSMISTHEFAVTLRQDETEVGGGTLPGVKLPTWVLALTSDRMPPHVAEKKLRMCDPAVIARIHRDSLLIDLRTVQDDELEDVAKAINNIGGQQLFTK